MEVLNSQKLKNLMIFKCMSISQLAKLANVQETIIAKFLKSDAKIRLSTLGKICKALDIQPTAILKE